MLSNPARYAGMKWSGCHLDALLRYLGVAPLERILRNVCHPINGHQTEKESRIGPGFNRARVGAHGRSQAPGILDISYGAPFSSSAA